MNFSRYGPLFRTSIFGSKTVVSTDPDVNFNIFREESTSFEAGYPDIFVKVFGKDNLFLQGVNVHKYLKKLTMQLIGPETLKQTMIGYIDKAIHDHFRLKASQGSFDVRKGVEDVSLHIFINLAEQFQIELINSSDPFLQLVVAYMTPKLISDLKPETQSKLIDNLHGFTFDWFQSFSLSTRKALVKVLKVIKKYQFLFFFFSFSEFFLL